MFVFHNLNKGIGGFSPENSLKHDGHLVSSNIVDTTGSASNDETNKKKDYETDNMGGGHQEGHKNSSNNEAQQSEDGKGVQEKFAWTPII